MPNKQYRLVTRSDFDGLVCAVLFKELDMINDILFVHPKDMQDGKIDITENDITTNLPYVENAHLAFDHHASEMLRVEQRNNYICEPTAPSASRVVYNYFGANKRFPNVPGEMMVAVDKADSAQFSLNDIMYPRGWVLLSFIMDPRTGLGRFKNFRISNYQLMLKLIDACRAKTIDQILEMPDVQERVDMYFHHEERFKDQIRRCTTLFDNIAVLDLRSEEIIYPGNRFMLYALFPTCNISIHVIWGKDKINTLLAAGKSIFNKSSSVNIGELMFSYGGGGHINAGTCQIDNDKADDILKELIAKIKANA
jgi:nanoRNase/pAp phosphatase (c-di-AMP/oligoRNAs hydrolase)